MGTTLLLDFMGPRTLHSLVQRVWKRLNAFEQRSSVFWTALDPVSPVSYLSAPLPVQDISMLLSR